jgi:hypothetical protein
MKRQICQNALYLFLYFGGLGLLGPWHSWGGQKDPRLAP